MRWLLTVILVLGLALFGMACQGEEEEAGEATLDLIDAGNLQGANERIRSARKEVLPTRRAVVKLMAGLRGLQAQFIRASGQP